MHTLPQLAVEDITKIEAALDDLLKRTKATAAVVADKGGFLIAHRGGTAAMDFTTLAALASGAYMATQTIAGLIEESEFDSVCQQGRDHSLFVQSVDDCCMLLVIHPASVGVGAVKYFAAGARRSIASQMKAAHNRAPDEGLDLSVLNLVDTSALFQR